jgi:hypothetical protein
LRARSCSKRILGVRRRVLSALIVAIGLTIGLGAAAAETSWPGRGTPLSSTLGWFKAINAHDRRQLLFYVAPSARPQMGWARPSVAWPKFTDLQCRALKALHGTRAGVRCTFHESGASSEGNPDTFWDVYLGYTRGTWLIDSYGQG